MRESTHPLECSLGMHYYASDTPGLGGRLRASAQDFIVEEVPCLVGEEGPYLICRLTKKDWELQRAVKELAKRLGISHRRIGWAGTKDRRALTSQLISLYDITPEQVARVDVKDMRLEVVGRSRTGLTLGSLEGNRFRINIRDIEKPDPEAEVAEVTEACRRGIPNYFGVQRFGVIRPLTHLVGEAILRGDYEAAVCCYAGRAFPDEPLEVQEARRAFLETRDPVATLRAFPVPLTYERSMLHHLVSSPGDYRGALLVLAPKLRSMFVSAFQSWLFNMTLSSRLREGRGLTDPVPGDRLVFVNGKEDRVTPAGVAAARVQVARGRCRIGIFMPGSLTFVPEGPDDETMAGLLAQHGITSASFDRASEYVGTYFNGAIRPISLAADVEARFEEGNLALSFTLPPGHYATTVCREYMKADPLKMV
ncbi:tRNA pseudouridine13 synthase [Methanolinea mesophila]|uniref:tRNA pseudouridine(13) synthase TruD n=1 Tax=Methanolinea mesophila TaxID=547055 RepID=UPI001AE6CF6E|nr:tRNA pseudouridine(13) synthase TruD [Methanolinea mesophila]MBP1928191.1 tRNA pseudouridine13 synthase [Methanolinea mesophila]